MFKSEQFKKQAGLLTFTPSVSEWVEQISGSELQARPGEQYSYSNVNYNLLGAIIEQVSGISFKEYMKQEILTP